MSLDDITFTLDDKLDKSYNTNFRKIIESEEYKQYRLDPDFNIFEKYLKHTAPVACWEYYRSFIKDSEKNVAAFDTDIQNLMVSSLMDSFFQDYIPSAIKLFFDHVKNTHIKDVVEGFEDFSCLIFFGAGVSKEAGITLRNGVNKMLCSLLIRKGKIKNWKEFEERRYYYWEQVKTDKQLNLDFKTLFKNYIDDRKGSFKSHSHICFSLLFKSGICKCLMTTNWDDLLEYYYAKIFDKDIYDKRIIISPNCPPVIGEYYYKLHGCVNNLDFTDDSWIYPYDGGRIPSSFNDLASGYQKVIIAGVGGDDPIVNDYLEQFQPCNPLKIRFTNDPAKMNIDYIKDTGIIPLPSSLVMRAIVMELHRKRNVSISNTITEEELLTQLN